MRTRALIETLNNLSFGELGTVTRRVGEVRDEADQLELDEIVAILDEALRALGEGDLKLFRKRLNHAVSRLGHAKVRESEPAV